MDLILKQDVQNLGFKDDVVSVKPGYGRNFLIGVFQFHKNKNFLPSIK